MGSISTGDRHKEEFREEQAASSTDGHNLSNLGDFIPIYVSTVEMDHSHTDERSRRSSCFRVPFVGKINWRGMIKSFRHWIRDPGNVGMFIWLVVVLAGIILLSLLMLGALDGAIPQSTRRKKWIEVIYQFLNPLFMLLCLYEHPQLFYHLALLLRWRPSDAAELRRKYCKDGAPRPHERAHLLFVLLLLHSCFFATYVLCALYWAYSRTSRPDWAVNIAIGVAIAPLIIAGVYLVKSPLGKKYETDVELQQRQATAMPDQAELDRIQRRIVVTNPHWIGGLFDCCTNVTVAVPSFCCTFCVFGWNMERLGFGNKYVHIATFMLLCISPFFVFGAAYLSIDNNVAKYVAGGVGIVLSFFGLLYAGYYRIQMRKKFKLPGNKKCCGSATVTDCLSWQFCWSCALSQEVRTANFFEIGGESFYRRDVEDEDGRGHIRMLPMSREGGISPAKTGTDDISLLGQAYTTRANPYVEPHVMRPPVHQLFQLGDHEV